MPRKRSKVWNFFTKLNKDQGRCLKCKNNFEAKGGNTSNLINHLRIHHPNIHFEFLSIKSQDNNFNKNDLNETDDISDPPCDIGNNSAEYHELVPLNSSTNLVHKSCTLKQQSMNVYKKLDKTTSEKYTNAIAYWIVTDMQPYRSVSKQGFQHLMSVICPGYTIPSRQFFADNKIPALYFEVKRRIKHDLNSAQFLSLTFDCWTSNAQQPYIGITAHTINSGWVLQTYCIACTILDVDHTATNLKDIIESTLKDWNIPMSKVSAATTDNGTNVIKAVQLMDLNHNSCFGHTLNNGLKSRKIKYLPNCNEQKLILVMCKIFEPLKTLGEHMGAEKVVTASSIWPVYTKLEKTLLHTNSSNFTCALTQEESTRANNSEHFGDSEQLFPILSQCTLMDNDINSYFNTNEVCEDISDD
ncbi:zinc finger BED domain-containing protein 6-like [Aphis gossypii]|uniref:zinc finger BED domain-containing protein 6-like n=1 Tax=Aphis gossypii TaxID=80765 RepID=UPI002159462D|nr:zinc finger BED domain-containing protein 6-like [Aphis gossypii]